MAGEVVGSVNLGSLGNEHVRANANIDRSKLAAKTLRAFPVPLSDLREWDVVRALLPQTATGTYLGCTTGTFGTDAVQVDTGDLHSAGATTRRARQLIVLPDTYDDGGNIKIRLTAGMQTHVADTSATIDVECYQVADDGTLSADLCATAAQSINNLTAAAKDFTITPTGLTAGMVLDVRVSIAVNDAANSSAVIGRIRSMLLCCDVRP